MFDYIKGFVTDKRKNTKGCFVTLESANIVYLLEVTEQDFESIQVNEDSPIKFYTSLIHREDAMLLYGFSGKETRDIFQILISVSGVGTKMAISLLSEFDLYDLISFVVNENFKELTRAKGVGVKLAQKIILELKDKLIKTNLSSPVEYIPNNSATKDAQAIMLSLGYEEKEIETVLKNVMASAPNETNPEEILRKALTLLSV